MLGSFYLFLHCCTFTLLLVRLLTNPILGHLKRGVSRICSIRTIASTLLAMYSACPLQSLLGLWRGRPAAVLAHRQLFSARWACHQLFGLWGLQATPHIDADSYGLTAHWVCAERRGRGRAARRHGGLTCHERRAAPPDDATSENDSCKRNIKIIASSLHHIA